MELKVTLGPAAGGTESSRRGHHGAGNVVSSQSISFAFLLSVLLKKALLGSGLHGKFISLLLTLWGKKRKKKVIIKRIQHKFSGRIRRSSLKKKGGRGKEEKTTLNNPSVLA